MNALRLVGTQPPRVDSTRAAARAAVAEYARKVMAESRLYGRESAMTFALGYLEPNPQASDRENLSKVRGAIEGLEDAGVFPGPTQ